MFVLDEYGGVISTNGVAEVQQSGASAFDRWHKYDGLKTQKKVLEKKKFAEYDEGDYFGDFVDGKRHGKNKF